MTFCEQLLHADYSKALNLGDILILPSQCDSHPGLD
jgi:hypothetical protein